MSSDSSTATKVLIGCLIAFVVGVLVCSGAILLVGYWGVGVIKEVAKEMPVVLENLELIQLAETWQAPAADAGPDVLFPATVGTWTQTGHDEQAVIPELAIERDGLHATYGPAGTVHVYAYRVPEAEQAQVMDAAIAAIDAAPYSTRRREKTQIGATHVMSFKFSPPERIGSIWWNSDWLFVLLTDSSSVNFSGFQRDYLNAIRPPFDFENIEAVPMDPAPEATLPPAVPAADSLPVPNDPTNSDQPDEPTAPSRSERQAQ